MRNKNTSYEQLKGDAGRGCIGCVVLIFLALWCFIIGMAILMYNSV